MNSGVSEQVGETTRSFFEVMRTEPLSLGLVVSNFVLLGYLFYSGYTVSTQRNETTKLIVSWQQDSDKLMASCVSKEIMETVVRALERDRELYRSLLPRPDVPQPPSPLPEVLKPQ